MQHEDMNAAFSRIFGGAESTQRQSMGQGYDPHVEKSPIYDHPENKVTGKQSKEQLEKMDLFINRALEKKDANAIELHNGIVVYHRHVSRKQGKTENDILVLNWIPLIIDRIRERFNLR